MTPGADIIMTAAGFPMGHWCLIGDDGGPDSASVCGFVDAAENICEEDGAYSLLRHASGMWYALCVDHTAFVRAELGDDIAAVKDVRPVGVRDEEHNAALSEWVAAYQRGEVR